MDDDLKFFTNEPARDLYGNQGRVVEYGKTDDVINRPQADYTKTLLASVPEIGGRRYI